MAKYSTWYDDEKNIHVFVLDQTKPEDRIFRLTPHDTLEKINEIMIVHLPDGMRDKLKEAANVNGRSLNAEIIARLESFKAPTFDSQLDRMEEKINRLLTGRRIGTPSIFQVYERLNKKKVNHERY
ncbi:Arc family DNA-binding protein [Bartonella apihabitans]|nr:Arc family DNA-binding protein [Bartonella apihabitans]WLT09620.1 Arc family DNA-binding protein [Bartonella apihabitans]